MSSAYALSYPSKIKHLILEDPWGYSEYDPERRSKFPLWTRTILGVLMHVNVLSTVRAAGPYGEATGSRSMLTSRGRNNCSA